LREGNVYTSNGVVDFVKPILSEFNGVQLKSRGDSGFAVPELFELYEENDVLYYIKLKANSVVAKIGLNYLKDHQIAVKNDEPFYFETVYSAQSWNKPRRVLCKAEYYHMELVSQLIVSFVVTNDLTLSPEDGFNFYNGRANVENCIKEIKLDLSMGKLSLHSFIGNACRLQIFALAYNINNLLKRLILPPSLKSKRLSTLRIYLIRIGAKIVSHSRKLIINLSSSFGLETEYVQAFKNISNIPHSYG